MQEDDDVSGSKRERELERQRWERQQQRRADQAAKQRRRNTLIASITSAVVVVALLVWVAIAVGGGGDHQASASASSPAPSTAASAAPCSYISDPAQQTGGKKPGLPPVSPITGGYTANLALRSTEASGTVSVALQTDAAPCTSNSFVYLAKAKFFDATTCHRLTTTGIYVLQCGDPTGTGSGGPGYKFGDENLPGQPASAGATPSGAGQAVTYPAGTVAMANSGPNTNGSQFFIVYKDSTMGPDYSVFGKVTSGMDIVDKIAAAGVTGSGEMTAPKNKVTITTVTVKKG